MKIRSLLPIYLLLVLLSGGAAQQRPSAKTDAKKEALLAKTWKGESICFADFKPQCHDEVVVYHVTQSSDKPSTLSIQADKIVNGQPEDMGTLDCTFDNSKSTVTCAIPRGVFRFTVRSNKMDGGLWAPDGKQIRRINLTRAE
ncbi:MAG: hypothetical protein JWO13_3195 [Acidobacteriales bacterium]|nr:hypothetical protein [Terriglobales bacterium]